MRRGTFSLSPSPSPSRQHSRAALFRLRAVIVEDNDTQGIREVTLYEYIRQKSVCSFWIPDMSADNHFAEVIRNLGAGVLALWPTFNPTFIDMSPPSILSN